MACREPKRTPTRFASKVWKVPNNCPGSAAGYRIPGDHVDVFHTAGTSRWTCNNHGDNDRPINHTRTQGDTRNGGGFTSLNDCCVRAGHPAASLDAAMAEVEDRWEPHAPANYRRGTACRRRRTSRRTHWFEWSIRCYSALHKKPRNNAFDESAQSHARPSTVTHSRPTPLGRTRVSENWAGGSTTRFHTAIVRRSSNAPFGDHSIRTASAEAPAQRHRRVIKPRPVVQSRWPSRTPRSAVPRPASAMRGVLTHLDSALRR